MLLPLPVREQSVAAVSQPGRQRKQLVLKPTESRLSWPQSTCTPTELPVAAQPTWQEVHSGREVCAMLLHLLCGVADPGVGEHESVSLRA